MALLHWRDRLESANQKFESTLRRKSSWSRKISTRHFTGNARRGPSLRVLAGKSATLRHLADPARFRSLLPV